MLTFLKPHFVRSRYSRKKLETSHLGCLHFQTPFCEVQVFRKNTGNFPSGMLPFLKPHFVRSRYSRKKLGTIPSGMLPFLKATFCEAQVFQGKKMGMVPSGMLPFLEPHFVRSRYSRKKLGTIHLGCFHF